jgi:hypothetical protein
MQTIPGPPTRRYEREPPRSCCTSRVLRDPAQARELERGLRLTPFARAEFEAAYRPGCCGMRRSCHE